MKRNILSIGLAISLCFNFFFALGFYRSRVLKKQSNTPEARAAKLAARLRLSVSQQKKYHGLQRSLRGRIQRIKQQRQLRQDAIIAEMEEAELNPRRIKGLLRKISRDEVQKRVVVSEHVVEFVKVLTPTQRRQMSEIIRSVYAENGVKDSL